MNGKSLVLIFGAIFSFLKIVSISHTTTDEMAAVKYITAKKKFSSPPLCPFILMQKLTSPFATDAARGMNIAPLNDFLSLLGIAFSITITETDKARPMICISLACSLKNMCERITGKTKFKFINITDIDRELTFIDSIRMNAAKNIHAPDTIATGMSEYEALEGDIAKITVKSTPKMKNHKDGIRADEDTEWLPSESFLYMFPVNPEERIHTMIKMAVIIYGNRVPL